MGAGLLVFLPAMVMAEFTVSEYKYQKDLISSGTQAGDFSFVVDEQIYEHGDQFFSDLRVVNQNNAEIPYVVEKVFDRIDTETQDIELDIVSQSNEVYVLDMGETPAYHQSVRVETESFDFSRVVDIYGSNLPDTRFEDLTLNAQGDLVAVVPGNDDKSITFKYSNYRYIKLIFSGKEGDFVPTKFTTKYSETQKVEGVKKQISLDMESLESEKPSQQTLLFTVEGINTPINSLVIHTAETDFDRDITLYVANDKNAQILADSQRYDKDRVYWKQVYHGSFSEKAYSEEQMFAASDNKKYYLAVIDNADNAQLNIAGATATQFLNTVNLKDLDFSVNNYKIFYGNIFATKPKYDTEIFNGKLEDSESVELSLSDQQDNLLYVAPQEKLTEDKPYMIYVFIVILIAILFWFVFKIIRETNNKDGGEEVDIIEKL